MEGSKEKGLSGLSVLSRVPSSSSFLHLPSTSFPSATREEGSWRETKKEMKMQKISPKSFLLRAPSLVTTLPHLPPSRRSGPSVRAPAQPPPAPPPLGGPCPHSPLDTPHSSRRRGKLSLPGRRRKRRRGQNSGPPQMWYDISS